MTDSNELGTAASAVRRAIPMSHHIFFSFIFTVCGQQFRLTIISISIKGYDESDEQ